MTAKAASAPVEQSPEPQITMAEFRETMRLEREQMMAEMAAMRGTIIEELAQHTAAQQQIAQPASVVPSMAADATSMLAELAMRIAELTNQGNKAEKPIDPRILAEREAAMNRMGELIIGAQSLPVSEQPIYFLIAKTYLKDRLVEPFSRGPDKNVVRTEIRWTRAPNSAMRPKNVSAKAIYREFVKWIGGNEGLSGQVKIPQWATEKGTILVNPPGASASVHLAVPEPVPYDFDNTIDHVGTGVVEDDDPEFKVMSAQDPTAPEIRVLGSLHPPARRMDPAERRA